MKESMAKRMYNSVYNTTQNILLTTFCVAVGIGAGILINYLLENKRYNEQIKANPIVLDGTVISENLGDSNLEIILGMGEKEISVNFKESGWSIDGGSDLGYTHHSQLLPIIADKVDSGDKVRITGFQDPVTKKIYGKDIQKEGYVSLLNR